MEFIVADQNRMEVHGLPSSCEIDFDIGDMNDVEIVSEKGIFQFGMYLICPGTEYGALIEEMDQWTNEKIETWRGNAFRKFLQQFIISPPVGQDYMQVSGDAHEIMRTVLNGTFDNLFTVPGSDSGINIGTYKFDRYTDALTGFSKMLKSKNARINIEIKQGGSGEAFSVILSAVPIKNLSEEIEYSEDSKIAVNLKESRRGINHIICLGRGELKDRQIIHLYMSPDGTVGQTQHFVGVEERTAVYDYPNAESVNILIEKGEEELRKLTNNQSLVMTAQDIDLQIGDIIGGRSYETGLSVQKPVVQKIVKFGEELTIDYKVEGEK